MEDFLQELLHLQVDFLSQNIQLRNIRNFVPPNPFETADRKRIEEPTRKIQRSTSTASLAPPKIFYGRFWRSLTKRVMERYMADLRCCLLQSMDSNADGVLPYCMDGNKFSI